MRWQKWAGWNVDWILLSHCRECRPHPTGFGEPLKDLRQGRLGLDLHFLEIPLLLAEL